MQLRSFFQKALEPANDPQEPQKYRQVRRSTWLKGIYVYIRRHPSLVSHPPSNYIPTPNINYPAVTLTLYGEKLVLYENWSPSLEDLIADDWELLSN